MKKMSNRFALALVCCAVSILTPTHAQMSLNPLNNADIQGAVLGTLMAGEYPDGTQWSERFNQDGTSDYAQNGKSYKSTMTLSGNLLCFQYYDPGFSGGCFEIWRRGPNCFDFYASNNSANLDDRRFGRSWSARGWYPDRPRTCISENIS